MRGRLENYEAGAIKLVSEGEIDQAKKDVARFCNEWRKRKRACNEIIETICESADLNKRDFVVSHHKRC
jgi:hypothetical protein